MDEEIILYDSYEFLVGFFTYRYFLIEDKCIEKILKTRDLNLNNLDQNLQNIIQRISSAHKQRKFINILLSEFLNIKEERKIVLHGVYGFTDNGYAIQKLANESYHNIIKHYDSLLPLRDLNERCIVWLKCFQHLIWQFPELDKTNQWNLACSVFPFQEKDVQRGFELIGKLIIKFSHIEANIDTWWKNCKEKNINSDLEFPLSRLQLMWFGKRKNVKDNEELKVIRPDQQASYDLFVKINSLRNKISHKFLKLESLEEIENGIMFCNQFINSLYCEEDGIEYECAWFWEDSDFVQNIMNSNIST